MISQQQRKIINDRSGGQCEAMVLVPPRRVWSRCWKSPVELHHLLTRARGGGILDEVQETYHLLALCSECHRKSDGGSAYMAGLLIDGYVGREQGAVVYQGSDEYLSKKYRRKK